MNLEEKVYNCWPGQNKHQVGCPHRDWEKANQPSEKKEDCNCRKDYGIGRDMHYPDCNYFFQKTQPNWQEKYWEKFGKLAQNPLANGLKDFISQVEQRAVEREKENWINQPANQHDEKIRKAERNRIVEMVEGMNKEPVKGTYCGCDGECFANCNDSFNQALEDIINKINQK